MINPIVKKTSYDSQISVQPNKKVSDQHFYLDEGLSQKTESRLSPSTFRTYAMYLPSPVGIEERQTPDICFATKRIEKKQCAFSRKKLTLQIAQEDRFIADVETNECISSIQKIRNTRMKDARYWYQIARNDGVLFKMEHMTRRAITGDDVPVSGAFSQIFQICPGQPSLYPGIDNDTLLVKVLRDNQLYATQSCPYAADQKLAIAKAQYQFLSNYFLQKGIVNPPIVRIYNIEDSVRCGYTIIQKVEPLSAPLWDSSVAFDQLTPMQKRDYDVVCQLLEANEYIGMQLELDHQDRQLSRMDLKWNNLGRFEGNLVLLDYVNVPLSLPAGESAGSILANGNKDIEQRLIQYEEATYQRLRESKKKNDVVAYTTVQIAQRTFIPS